MKIYYLLYAPTSNTLGITNAEFTSENQFLRFFEEKYKFYKLVFWHKYEYLVKDKKAEILAELDKKCIGLAEYFKN